MKRTRIAIYGAAGRMGQAVLRAALAHRDAELCAAVVNADSELVGEPLSRVFGADAPPIEFSAALDPDAHAEVLVDFTGPRAFDTALAIARSRAIPFVSGTTGLSADQHQALADAGGAIPVLWSANFSVGVAVLRRLAALAATVLPLEFDAEIVEMHHRHKQDAPSGTALALGRAIAEARRLGFEDVARYARHGQVGPRADGEIGFAAIRGGDVVGEHSVIFAAPGERIELTHRAGSRAVFSEGAVRSAVWLARQRPGVYDIADVIG